MPFTNHIIPVDVTINGEYQGSYMFTEDKEVKGNRIDIGDDRVLLEMDTTFLLAVVPLGNAATEHISGVPFR